MSSYEWTYSNGETADRAIADRCFDNTTNQTLYYGINLIATTDNGCKDTANAVDYIHVYHNPIADFDFEPKDADIIHSIINFENLSLYANAYDWAFGNFETSPHFEPTIEFPAIAGEHLVRLIVTTLNGCADTTLRKVPLIDKLIFYVPNTFTPDNNSVNEVFSPVFYSGFDPYNYKLLIFNRWGETLFESNNANVGWNGTYNGDIVQSGTYTWKIYYQRSDSDERQIVVGHVNVIR
jgi:gliding motility-associated-like protein